MRKILICLIVVTICASFTYAQSKTRRSNATACLSITEAKDLVLNLKLFRETEAFDFTSGTARYTDHDLPTMKRNYPILYLFYQVGYVSLEDNGVHTFSTLTSKGERLNRQYNGSIPFSTQTLVSVNKVTCTKNKAMIDVTISAKPVQTAVHLLGNAIYKTKPFNRNSNMKLEAKRVNGKWKTDELNLIFTEFNLS